MRKPPNIVVMQLSRKRALFGVPGVKLGTAVPSPMAALGTSVWTGRALQVGYDGLEIVGLAHLYSAL